MRRAGRLLAGLALLAAAAPGTADVRRVEAVGAVAVAADAPPGASLREAALRAGLAEAVQRAALDLLRAEGRGGEAGVDLGVLLGPDPREYAVRFRILEDYGERARVFLASSPAATEYVVIVEAHVDEDRVRAKLAEAGLLAGAFGAGPAAGVRVILEPLDSYRALAWAQEALRTAGGASSVVPLELERGRAVLLAETRLRPDEIARRLARAAPEGIRVRLREASRETLSLEVTAAPRPAAAAAGN